MSPLRVPEGGLRVRVRPQPAHRRTAARRAIDDSLLDAALKLADYADTHCYHPEVVALCYEAIRLHRRFINWCVYIDGHMLDAHIETLG